MPHSFNRRKFIKASALTGASLAIADSIKALAPAKKDKVRIGMIGVGLRSHAGLPASARGLLFGAMLAITYLFAETRATFIYFQF